MTHYNLADYELLDKMLYKSQNIVGTFLMYHTRKKIIKAAAWRYLLLLILASMLTG